MRWRWRHASAWRRQATPQGRGATDRSQCGEAAGAGAVEQLRGEALGRKGLEAVRSPGEPAPPGLPLSSTAGTDAKRPASSFLQFNPLRTVTAHRARGPSMRPVRFMSASGLPPASTTALACSYVVWFLNPAFFEAKSRAFPKGAKFCTFLPCHPASSFSIASPILTRSFGAAELPEC